MVFLLISVLIFNLVAYLIPKQLSTDEMYTTSLFALTFQMYFDGILNQKYDLLGYFYTGSGFEALIPVIGLYPAGSIIFSNYYPYTKSFKIKFLYGLGWTLLSLVFEQASLLSGYFYYHGWKLWYSALCYPPIFFILAWNLSYIRKIKGT